MKSDKEICYIANNSKYNELNKTEYGFYNYKIDGNNLNFDVVEVSNSGYIRYGFIFNIELESFYLKSNYVKNSINKNLMISY